MLEALGAMMAKKSAASKNPSKPKAVIGASGRPAPRSKSDRIFAELESKRTPGAAAGAKGKFTARREAAVAGAKAKFTAKREAVGKQKEAVKSAFEKKKASVAKKLPRLLY